MKILGLISSPTDPASRARITQYKDYFSRSENCLTPRFYSPFRESDPAPWTYGLKKITGINQWRATNFIKTATRLPILLQQHKYDIIWQNRMLLPHHFFFESKYKKPFVFDFDDAIWLNEGEKQVNAALTRADMVFAGNNYLADYAAKLNSNTHVIPTTVDTEKLFPVKTMQDKFTLGWIGSESNFKYLDLIKPAILDFLSKHEDSCFTVVSSKKPTQFTFDDTQIIFKEWVATSENEMINDFSIGLMPLEDNDWTKGKCSYKMLQYMACGKPVIVSPVGMNKQLLAEGDIGYAAENYQDWLTAFTEVKSNKEDAIKKGEIGRKVVETNYSCKIMAPRIIRLFKTINK